MLERVWVTGMGIVSPIGQGVEPFREGLNAGRSGIAEAPFDTTGRRSHRVAKLKGFDPARHIEPMKLRRMDEVGRLAVVTGRLALQDAGVDLAGQGSDELGVALGSYTAGIHSTVEFLEPLMTRGPGDVIPLIFANTVGNAPASLLAIDQGLRGPNVTVSHKEASSAGAIAWSVGLIRHRRIPAMLAGGADDIHRIFHAVHDRFRALSPQDRGDEAARPFDRRRNGFVLGEGGALLHLEAGSRARARSARAWGEIVGVGSSASPTPLNAWPRSPRELVQAIRAALDDAALAAREVDLVLATACGARELDAVEARALAEVFGPRGVPVCSIKGAVGESSVGGAYGIAAALLALDSGMLPPTAGLETPDPELAVDVRPERRALAGRVALVLSVASGGTNHAVILRRVSTEAA